MWTERIDEYIQLIRQFIAFQIDAVSFERRFYEMYMDEDHAVFFPEPIFLVLDKLFWELDAFCPDPALRDEDDLDETQLREKASAALNELLALRDSTR